MNIYKGQSKEYLQKLEAGIEKDGIQVDELTRAKVREALEWSDIKDSDRPCKGTCDRSCWLGCKNL